MTQGGGLLQLVAIGPQDVYLTGNPQTTFFKAVYRRHTQFSVESNRMYFDGTPDFGQKISCLVPRLGDLLGNLFLVVTLPALTLPNGTPVGYTNAIGHALIEEISVQIGSQEIDKQTGEWMHLWSKLSVEASKKTGFQQLIGEIDGFPSVTQMGPVTLHIPLQFWFCNNPGLYLPLIALQYHPVRINISLAPLQKLFYTNNLVTSEDPCSIIVNKASITNVELWGDYVYLDVQERRRFTSSPLEYLIHQVQYTPHFPVPPTANSGTFQLDFNHPCKEFFWVLQRNKMLDTHEYFNYSSLASNEVGPGPYDLITNALIQLDGQDRFEKRGPVYFRTIQPYQRHTSIPSGQYIYCYSFALRPEDIQPTGTLNCSRIEKVVLQITPNNTVAELPSGGRGAMSCHVYALNYNVLRVIGGMAGLRFPA